MIAAVNQAVTAILGKPWVDIMMSVAYAHVAAAKLPN